MAIAVVVGKAKVLPILVFVDCILVGIDCNGFDITISRLRGEYFDDFLVS